MKPPGGDADRIREGTSLPPPDKQVVCFLPNFTKKDTPFP
jgi:hypothetical protein